MAVKRAIDLHEGFEHPPQISLGDAYPGIGDNDLEPILRAAAAGNRVGSAVLSDLHRIADQAE